jgi:hypothetical protein
MPNSFRFNIAILADWPGKMQTVNLEKQNSCIGAMKCGILLIAVALLGSKRKSLFLEN